MAEFSARGHAFRNVVATDLPAVYDLYRAIEPQDEIEAARFARWWQWLYADNPRKLSVVLGEKGLADRVVNLL